VHLVEERIDSEQVYRGRLLDVRRDTVRLPDGHTATREYIVHPGAVLVVPRFPDGRVIVVRQFRYANNAVIEVALRTRCLKESGTPATTFPVIAGTATFAIDPATIIVSKAQMAGQKHPLILTTAKDLDRRLPGWDTDMVPAGVPEYVVFDLAQHRVTLVPTPAEDSTLSLRGEVARVIRQLQPEVVLSHDPWKRYRLHPDHRHAGLLACDGIVAARDPHFFKEHHLPHHRPAALLLWEADQPNHVEDVTGHVDTKLRALEAHESQFESTMKATDDDQVEAFRQRIRTRLAGLGTPHDIGAAEVFHLMTDL
jgi:hypothetical protein